MKLPSPPFFLNLPDDGFVAAQNLDELFDHTIISAAARLS